MGREDLEARVAEGPAPGRGPGGHGRCTQGEGERGAIGEHVPGVREQRQGVAEKPGDDLPRHQREDEQQRDRQRPAVRGQPVLVIVVRARRLATRPLANSSCPGGGVYGSRRSWVAAGRLRQARRNPWAASRSRSPPVFLEIRSAMTPRIERWAVTGSNRRAPACKGLRGTNADR